jgi:hypothetical protein
MSKGLGLGNLSAGVLNLAIAVLLPPSPLNAVVGVICTSIGVLILAGNRQ